MESPDSRERAEVHHFDWTIRAFLSALTKTPPLLGLQVKTETTKNVTVKSDIFLEKNNHLLQGPPQDNI